MIDFKTKEYFKLPILLFFATISIQFQSFAQDQREIDSLDCIFTVDRLIRYAEQYQGCPYVWAANGPDYFDCSGFVHYVFDHFGYNVKRNSKQLSMEGRELSIVEVRKGDLIFFFSGEPPERDVTHVGIAISDYDPKTLNFQFIHANKRDNCVAISNYNEPRFRNSSGCARRVIPCLDN